jgi:molybdopterin converting factor small subunit
MKMKLQTMDPQMRAILGWERKTEEVYETTAETLGDFFKDVTDKDGRTFYDRFMDENDIIVANSYIFFNCMAFLKKGDFDRAIKDGDKVILLRSLAGCGAG